jgi:adenylate kinase family enzyme
MPQPFQIPGPRISVVGVTGSGKTTTAARLSSIMGIPHVEIDSIHWLPGWQEMDLEPFRDAVARAASGPTWVIDGNYSKVRDLIWDKATTLVWLDYALPVTLWQLLKRTIHRTHSKEILWNTNRETWRGAFFSRDSLFIWAFKSYPKHRKQYPLLVADPRYAHLQVIRLRTPRQTTAWLTWLAEEMRETAPAVN